MAKRKKLRKSLSQGRKPENKNPNTTFIMFCEGDTEVKYFNSLNNHLKDSNIVITTKKSNKTDCIGIHKYAENYKNSNNNEFDYYFLVFDKDYNSFENIEKVMSKKEYKILFSNPCFELWIILHYKLIDKKTDCKEIIKMIKKFIPNYSKGQNDLFTKLKDKLTIAIENNNKLLDNHCKLYNHKNFIKLNPYTNIFELYNIIKKA
ncbi:MAG: hypothetical protein PWP28_1635 [Oceanotoga sp.]|jgi:hypothetical protein|uniref:RloB-like protein n=1 Tax=Oceanotoga teriensis TaxID=515440 RepID=A0AA45HHX6_9BACT|nr:MULTISPECIES: RloB family protein [Oceanotoga]MDN5342760.1 hypothetical protein [Oceanotoga sp.]PWJ88065.1 RloB-like protein [Oceanotoga teriensis]